MRYTIHWLNDFETVFSLKRSFCSLLLLSFCLLAIIGYDYFFIFRQLWKNRLKLFFYIFLAIVCGYTNTDHG
jgi:hypothetical protein